MLQVLNRAEFNTQVSSAIAQKRGQIEARVQMAMRRAQLHARNISPVYSGDFASNWNVSVGAPDTMFNATVDYYGPEYPPPVASPWGNGNFNMPSGWLGQTVYLSNSAEHDEPYAMKIERGEINFRAINVGRSQVAARTLDSIKATWKMPV